MSASATTSKAGVNRRQAAGGFTLLEMLVATAVFAVVAVMAYGGLNAVIRQTDQTRTAQERLADVRRAVILLENDVAALEARAVRDSISGQIMPALQGGTSGFFNIELTRGGWRNPADLPRSTLQRVAWTIEGDELVRLDWPSLDQAQGVTPQRVTVLDRVRALQIRYLDADHEWQEQWPSLAISDAPADAPPEERLPIAIELTLDLEDMGRIRRLLEVGS